MARSNKSGGNVKISFGKKKTGKAHKGRGPKAKPTKPYRGQGRV